MERDFYWLSDLASGWGTTVSNLLHLGAGDRAQICANLHGTAGLGNDSMLPGSISWRDSAAGRVSPSAVDCEPRPDLDGGGPSMPDGVYELFPDDLRLLEMPQAFPFKLRYALRFDDGWSECDFRPPVMITADHLCMLPDEMRRLERGVFGKEREPEQMSATNVPAPPERSDILDPIVDQAIEAAGGLGDASQNGKIWRELVRMAQNPTAGGVLTRFKAADRDIPYLNSCGEPAFLSRKALAERLRRRRKKTTSHARPR